MQVRDGMNSGHDKEPGNITLCPTTFASKNLLSSEWCYSNIECEALGILHRLLKFHYYYFARELCIITDRKSLVAVLSKDMATLPQQLQHIMLCIHQ